jgi:Tfp pilus assembly protein PilF
MIGDQFFKMEKIGKLTQLLKDNPADSFLQHALALEYIKSGDDERAKKLFEEILKREPSYIGSYYHLARLLERNGDKEGAINWYNKGMEEAKKAGEVRTYNELRSAYDELVF